MFEVETKKRFSAQENRNIPWIWNADQKKKFFFPKMFRGFSDKNQKSVSNCSLQKTTIFCGFSQSKNLKLRDKLVHLDKLLNRARHRLRFQKQDIWQLYISSNFEI